MGAEDGAAGGGGAFSAVLWASSDHIYRAILAHPFLVGLADGTLPRAAFAHFLVQDTLYLRDYARALAVCAAKAPGEEDVRAFAGDAAEAVAAEQALHADLLGALAGLADPADPPSSADPADPADLGDLGDLGDPTDSAGGPAGGVGGVVGGQAAPTTQAYTSYLLATVYGGSFLEGLAAVLPCYWIYARVGAELRAASSPDPAYARWIVAYGDPSFQAVADRVVALADEVGAAASPRERAGAVRHFATTARYEWMFWDAAWRRESWPI